MSDASRPVAQVVKPEPVVEGAGVHLRRSIGTRGLDHLDPFLLLDHFESSRAEDYEPGFPYHPHAGSRPSRSSGQVRSSIGTRSDIRAASARATSSG